MLPFCVIKVQLNGKKHTPERIVSLARAMMRSAHAVLNKFVRSFATMPGLSDMETSR
jgi:hypothetical protein